MVFVPLLNTPKHPSSLTRTRPPRFIPPQKNLHPVLAVPGKAVRASSRRAQSKKVAPPFEFAACAVESLTTRVQGFCEAAKGKWAAIAEGYEMMVSNSHCNRSFLKSSFPLLLP